MGKLTKGASRVLNLNKRSVTDLLKQAAGRDGGPNGVCMRESLALMACIDGATDVGSQCRQHIQALSRCQKTALQEKNLRTKVRKSMIFQILKKQW
mmetsp:Transcript_7154/g.9814  ORF Transcript_7154/g.9814 Transcript_7154/m.9814 type:complete len:96 (-) Transcript_7154:253-540(-)